MNISWRQEPAHPPAALVSSTPTEAPDRTESRRNPPKPAESRRNSPKPAGSRHPEDLTEHDTEDLLMSDRRTSGQNLDQLLELNGEGSNEFTVRLVKNGKGAVMPVKKRKLPDAGDHEHRCKLSSLCRPPVHPVKPLAAIRSFSGKRCLAWFQEYAGPDKVVGPEAMEKFCEDIGVEPENVLMLVLAWHLEAANMGFFTRDEWLRGMTVLQCDCTERLQSKLDHLRSELNDAAAFRNIYRYAFDFSRDKNQRVLDMDTAKSMLHLLLGRTWPLFPVFHQFLEESKYKGLNRDQWYNVLEFSRTISPDLSNYDQDGAWPVLLDEFVEWRKSRSAS